MSASRKCTKCGVVVAADDIHAMFYRSGPALRRRGQEYASECVLCTKDYFQRINSGRKAWRNKAINSIAAHAKRAGLSREKFSEDYGWDPDVVESRFRLAFESGICPECNRRYREMAGGRRAVTIDICYPDKSPYWRTNTRVLCHECNTEKRSTPPEVWEIRRKYKKTRRDPPPDNQQEFRFGG